MNSNHQKGLRTSSSKAGVHSLDYGGSKANPESIVTSVLERGDLDEFVATAALARASFEAERRPDIVTGKSIAIAKPSQVEARYGQEVQVRVLRRPLWDEEMSLDQLTAAEDLAFLEWRGALAHLEEVEGLCLSPYEKNIDFWRQLWRTVEKSSVVVQILDARDPLFFFCEDLFTYVDEVANHQGSNKRKILVLNKADYVPADIRSKWREYFADLGFEAQFFSALSEVNKQTSQRDDIVIERCPDSAPVGEHHGGEDVLDCTGLLKVLEAQTGDEKVIVGMTGFPNVGKSTLINAITGSKRVSMSRQPGKTKHIQTLDLTAMLTLCDCPGIVMPSVVSSKAHLVINGTVKLDHIRDYRPAVALIVSRLGIKRLLQHYGCEAFYLPEFRKEGESRGFLCAYAVSRKYFLRLHLPDEFKAAKTLLKDFCDGRVPHFAVPPSSGLEVVAEESDDEFVDSTSARTYHDALETRANLEDTLEELTDIRNFISSTSQSLESEPTRRALRKDTKHSVKAERRSTAGKKLASKSPIPDCPVIKPGRKDGRMARALEDPYGCHRSDEHFI